jgi:hypothetical protein
VIELYAITDDPAPPEPPLRAVRCGDLTALCAPAEDRGLTPQALWRYEEVVETLMEERDLLPVRFGTLVPDEHAAEQAVVERRDELVSRLERVRGAVELAVRAEVSERPPERPDPEQSGRHYMRARAARMAQARALHEPLASLARDSVVKAGPELLRAAYLVDRENLERAVALVRDLQQANPALDLLCTGPWPPYSFSDRRQG